MRLFAHKYIFLLIILNTVVNNICALYLPKLMADIVDIGIKQYGCKDISMLANFSSQADVLQNQISYILRTGLIMLGVTGIIILFSIWTSYLSSKLSSRISCSLREDLFNSINNLSYEDRGRFDTSSLLTRCTGDVENVTALILMFSQFLIPPFMIIGGVIMIIQKSPSMSAIILVGSILIAMMISICFKIITPKIKMLQVLSDKFNRIFKERLTGISITRIFGNESYETEKFKKSHDELKNTSLFVSRISALISPVMTVLMNMTTALILWIGANEINNSNINIGDMMAFFQYAVMVITSFLVMSFFISSIPKSWVSVERVYEILCMYSNKGNGVQNAASENIKKINSIELKNLSFKYSNAEEYALKNINLKLDAQNSIGIIGTMGSGKSTLIKLLMGFYDSFEGNILIDGISMKNLNKEKFMENVAYVPQNSSIFSGDILSNLKLASSEINEEIIDEYSKIVCIDEFMKEKGLDFKIERGGRNVSGGQRQRLALLRAILKKADLYILDDSFSKLDFKTGLKVRKNLFSKFQEKIFVIISQRIETIKNLDKILVLDKGCAVGFGSHSELMGSCDIYKEMVALQFGGEEL